MMKTLKVAQTSGVRLVTDRVLSDPLTRDNNLVNPVLINWPSVPYDFIIRDLKPYSKSDSAVADV